MIKKKKKRYSEKKKNHKTICLGLSFFAENNSNEPTSLKGKHETVQLNSVVKEKRAERIKKKEKRTKKEGTGNISGDQSKSSLLSNRKTPQRTQKGKGNQPCREEALGRMKKTCNTGKTSLHPPG